MATIVDTQVHGYRRGHELLTASATLPKSDQSVVDRLSDVAGPLRLNERFDPYLTGYPLPTGAHYILARTWQDLDAPRAGCVRTRSLLIPITDWSLARSLMPFVDVLDIGSFPQETTAVAHEVDYDSSVRLLPSAPDFRAEDLLEALFLEEPKPIVVFDAPEPELIAIRLLTAVWPDYRARFSFSTFARSPRRIEGKYFDLVFAPKDARSKFSDWPGRRVDARTERAARHRWTGAIVQRVFDEPEPRLMSDEDAAVIGNDGAEASALRVALLWDELVGKLEQAPAAALGLLDIANARNLWDSKALRSLDPAIASAARRAVEMLPETEAWDFIGALVRKLRGRPLRTGQHELEQAATLLAAKAPEGAISLANQSDLDGAATTLIPAMAEGFASRFTDRTSATLRAARPDILGQLIATSEKLSAKAVDDLGLIHQLGEILPSIDPKLGGELQHRLLPLLREDRQLPILLPLVHNMDRGQLLSEVRHLGQSNGLRAATFIAPIVERAREIGALEELRDELLNQPVSTPRDGFVFATLAPTLADIGWIVSEKRLDRSLADQWILALLRMADLGEFAAALRDDALRERVLEAPRDAAFDVVRRAVAEAELPLDVHVRLLVEVLPWLSAQERKNLAGVALGQCLHSGFGGDEVATLATLLDIIGAELDAGWAARTGLDRGIPAPVASRNMKAFARLKEPARGRLLSAIDEVARVVEGRWVMDLDGSALHSFAGLLADAVTSNYGAALSASGRILPLAMRSRGEPVSPLVAVAFPMVYRELASEDDVPDILKFVPFIDWDRCKSARHELVDAFVSSSWPPGDLALIACRCGDVGKILRRTAKTYGGSAYISRIAGDLSRLEGSCRSTVERTISNMQADRSSRPDWSE